MKKQWKMIAIIGIVLLLLGGAAILLAGGNSEENVADNGQMIYEMEKTLLKDILVENSAGGYHLSCEETLKVEDMEQLPVDENGLKKIFNASYQLEAKKKIKDGGSRLNEFGLDRPDVKVTITKRNDEKVVFSIGEKTPEDDSAAYYVGWNEDVFVVEEDLLKVFFYGKENLISRSLTPAYDSSSDEVSIKEIVVTRSGETIKIQHKDSENLAGYVLDSYYIVSPIEYAASPSISEDFIPALFDLDAAAVVAVNPSKKELESFGLAEPEVTVDVSYTMSGEEEIIKLRSSKPTASGAVYVKTEEDAIVYLCTAAQISWSDMTLQDFVSKSVLTPDIGTLEHLVFKMEDGSSYTLNLEHMDDTENAKVSYEGTNFEMDSFKNFYYSLISITADEVVFENFPEMSEEDLILTVQFSYADGTKDEVRYYDQEARRIYAELNEEECGYHLNATQIENVKNNLQKLINGEKIEARY